jgi:hypothetical protein
MGRKYVVGVRADYAGTITSERQLIAALRKAIAAKNNPLIRENYERKLSSGQVLLICNDFGILNYTRAVNTRENQKG